MARTEGLVRGIIADVVVPYSKAEEPDLDRLAAEVKLLDASGVDGLSLGNVLGGTLGATATELAQLCVVMRRSSRTSIFVILFPDASPDGLEMARAVNDAGADALLAAQPHYLAQPGIDGLEEMFAAFREVTDLPLGDGHQRRHVDDVLDRDQVVQTAAQDLRLEARLTV